MEVSEIERYFTYQTPTDSSVEKLKAVRGAAKLLALTINNAMPECADKSAAMRLLRECVMTANAGIVLNQNKPENNNAPLRS